MSGTIIFIDCDTYCTKLQLSESILTNIVEVFLPYVPHRNSKIMNIELCVEGNLRNFKELTWKIKESSWGDFHGNIKIQYSDYIYQTYNPQLVTHLLHKLVKKSKQFVRFNSLIKTYYV